MRKFLLILSVLFCSLSAWATHQRAAEITYRWLGANSYEFTLTCYTYTPSPAGMQRDSLLMQWGDGTEGYVPRVVYENLGDDYTLNVYRMRHDYSSAGTYVVSMEDPNRNFGVVNVPNSVSVPMYIETEIVINPFLGYNNSVQLLNAPIDQGCVGKLYLHNPSAYDPDGDSLSFRLVPCKGLGGVDIPGYTYPHASESFDIDPATGELRWDHPLIQGEYNVAFIVEEWRGGVKIGSVIRDMQILISACNNDIPEIDCLDEACVVAGSQLTFTVSASDPDYDVVDLTASGAPFEQQVSPAVMNPETVQGVNPSFDFIWTPDCVQVRRTPYQAVFRAKDHGSPVSLTNVKTVRISVLGPPVEHLVSTPQGSEVVLEWDEYFCPNAESMMVYRKMGGDDYTPSECETGAPQGYQQIAVVDIGTTTFTDDNNGNGLGQGVDYCYRLVARFRDGAESVPSEPTCVTLRNDSPLMTRVSNDPSDLPSGRPLVAWSKPVEIDTQHQPPFSYKLSRYVSGNSTVIYSGSDTVFMDAQADINQMQVSYRVEMFDAVQQKVGESVRASSILLSGSGVDRAAQLSWSESVPWMIDSTQVFRQQGDVFRCVATVMGLSYTDRNLVNEQQYHYYVRTFGHYAIEGIERPLVNYSAIIAVIPGDNESPAPCTLDVDTDCDEKSNHLTWHHGGESDLAGFRIYQKVLAQEGFELIATIDDPQENTYLHNNLSSVVGCYYITAYDSHGNVSQASDTICVDYQVCPVYELPNVFTPNGDGYNDVYEPRHIQLSVIENVNMVIFNRWGNILFETEDPMIQWDGKSKQTHLDCPAGTYFYVCTVTFQGLNGQETLRLTGSITLVR